MDRGTPEGTARLSSNGRLGRLPPYFNRPALACAVLAVVVRLTAGLLAVAQNPLLTSRQLDSWYYVEWAREIAGGDFTGAAGIVQPDVRGPVPYILNSLYAFVLAPIVGIFRTPGLTPDEVAISDPRIAYAVVVFQALLAAGTTALTVVAARRFFGNAAAWVAGFAVALSASLVTLDAHVAVSGLAAFLVAGAVFASAPGRENSSGRGHGPVAVGLWLGIGALARPITQFALPFFAWKQWKEGGVRKALVVVAVFAACAVPSYLRNWLVTGDAVVYTSASGLNLHIGNNPESRRARTMASPHIRFSPIDMHYDAYLYVKDYGRLDHPPKPSEVSAYFQRKAIDELWKNPGESLVFYAQKARWFFSPVEAPSTGSLALDVRFTPLFRVAFVPTFVLAAAALVGAVLYRRRRDVVCGPTAMVLAHGIVLTTVFPISHYRSPAVPAMAVLAGGVVAWAVTAWRDGRKGRAGLAAVAVAAVAGLGSIPPQPAELPEMDALHLAMAAKDAKRWDEAIAYVKEAREARAKAAPNEPDIPMPDTLLGEIYARTKNYPKAVEHLKRAVAIDPHYWNAQLLLSRSAQLMVPPDIDLAVSAAVRVEQEYPTFWMGYERELDIRAFQPDQRERALWLVQRIRELGGTVRDPVLRTLGIR
jgi:hypothetical protein